MYLEEKRELDQPVKPIEPWRQRLFEAADLLEREGWCQGMLHDDYGRHCTVGAINRISKMNDALEAIRKLAFSVYGGGVCWSSECSGHLVCWNDQPGRTADEVIERMRSVATLP